MQSVPSSIQAKNTAARTHKQIPHPKKGLKRTHQETVTTIRIESNTWFYFRLPNTVCWVGEVQNTKQTPHSRYSRQNPKELPAASIRGGLVIRRSPRTRVGPVFFYVYDNTIGTRPYRTRTFTHLQMTYQDPRCQICFRRSKQRYIVKTTWRLKIPRSLGGDGEYG